MADKNSQVFIKGENETGSIKDYKFIDNKCQVTFTNGKQFMFNASNVRIIESTPSSPKSHDCLKYLKEVAKEIGLNTEVEPGRVRNILAEGYAKIDIAPQENMLTAFLSGVLMESNSFPTFDPVYPFGFNASQKSAVDKALNNRLSVIEGPPGTGKTQTILNIIANAVMRGESVAVVSNTNSATKNVIDKLEMYGVGFIAAQLGNTSNKRSFISAPPSLPDISAWKLESIDAYKLHADLKARYISLHEKLLLKNELSSLKQELSSIETEQAHFLNYAGSIFSYGDTEHFKDVGKAQDALDMWLLAESVECSGQKRSFIKTVIDRLFNRKNHRIHNHLKNYTQEQIISAYQHRFYELKISELSAKVADFANALEAFNFNAKMDEYSAISMRLFQDKVACRYFGEKRKDYKFEDLKRCSKSFINDYPVILSTTYSLHNSLNNQLTYDYVIVDESSQVDLCTGALALSCAKKAIIVGDLKQLPHVVNDITAKNTARIFANFDLPEVYRYKNHSLLSAVTELFPGVPSTLLREHYRCHPKIIEFCNQKFYDGQLITLTEPKSKREPLIVYKTVAGNHERSRMNQRQIDVILNEIIPDQNLNTQDNSLGIVTPYRNQTNAIQKAFAGTGIKADTVDKFQGQENEVIILSTVDNEITEFTDNANRLNVAVSRAINQLILVVSADDTQADTNIGDLVRYIEYNNFSVVDSQVYSVFDFLYKSYDERRRALLAKQKRVSQYDSENLLNALITDVLKEKEFSRFDVAIHVPLQMIIRDMDNLSVAEKQYARNVLTHVDFMIFDRIGKTPRLVVEVDGVSFHSEGSLQAERDKLKDEILRKFSLPIIRFRTDGSNERSRLKAALETV